MPNLQVQPKKNINIISLPDELLATLLEYSVSGTQEAALLSHVCRRIRLVALDCATLWTRNISPRMYPDAFLVACLKRSKAAGLHISITSKFDRHELFLDLIMAESERWETISVNVQCMDRESRTGLLKFNDRCVGLRLPCLKEYSIQGPHIFRSDVDDASIQFSKHWITPNVMRASFVRIIPTHLTCSPYYPELGPPSVSTPKQYFTAECLPLLQSISPLQELCIRFRTQYDLRFTSDEPITLSSLTTLKMFIPAGEKSSLFAPRSFFAVVRLPSLTHLGLNIRCDRHAAQYFQDKDETLLSLIPDPEFHTKLTSLELHISLLESWTDPPLTLRLVKPLSKTQYLRNLVVETDFNIAPLSTDNSNEEPAGLPHLRRIEFRDCKNFDFDCLHEWIRCLMLSGVWDGVEEISVRRCRFMDQESLQTLFPELKIRLHPSK